MPNIASILKNEIARVARKEVRAEVEPLRRAVRTYKSEITELKRLLQSLEKELRRSGNSPIRARSSVPEAAEDTEPGSRFSAKGLASHRNRLGLSAADAGLLIGSSGLSIYKWERGEARPRAKFLPAIVAFRALGKKEAMARLSSLR